MYYIYDFPLQVNLLADNNELPISYEITNKQEIEKIDIMLQNQKPLRLKIAQENENTYMYVDMRGNGVSGGFNRAYIGYISLLSLFVILQKVDGKTYLSLSRGRYNL